jgi:hypothetical protein
VRTYPASIGALGPEQPRRGLLPLLLLVPLHPAATDTHKPISTTHLSQTSTPQHTDRRRFRDSETKSVTRLVRTGRFRWPRRRRRSSGPRSWCRSRSRSGGKSRAAGSSAATTALQLEKTITARAIRLRPTGCKGVTSSHRPSLPNQDAPKGSEGSKGEFLVKTTTLSTMSAPTASGASPGPASHRGITS